MSGAPGTGSSNMEFVCSVGYINGNMQERSRFSYLNVMIKIWTLLRSRESWKDLELEDLYKQAEL